MLAAQFMIMVAGLLPVASCGGTILPSEAITVDTHLQQESVNEVAQYIDDLLLARGFARKGKDAYDEITQQDTVRDYTRGALVVSVSLDQPGRVYVRISERSEAWSDAAEAFLAEFSSIVDRQYPGRTQRKPVPENQE